MPGDAVINILPVAQGTATPVNAQYINNGVTVTKDLSNAYLMVDDTTSINFDDHDSDTTYIRFALGDADGANWTFKAADITFPANLTTIDAVRVRAAVSRLSLGGGAWSGVAIGHAGVVSNIGPPSYLALSSPNFIEVRHIMYFNPISGLPWQASDFTNQSFEIGYYKSSGPSRPICTSVFAEVYYSLSDFLPAQGAPVTTWTTAAGASSSWNAQGGPSTTWVVQDPAVS